MLRRIVFQPILALWLALLPLLWLSLTVTPRLWIDVGQWGDQSYLTGVNAPESGASEDYRWTTGQAELTVPNLASHYRLLSFRAHGWRADAASPNLTLTAGSLSMVVPLSATTRIYRVLLPPEPLALQRQVGFTTEPFSPDGDPRELGVLLDWIALGPFGASGPGIGQFVGQAVLLLLLLLLGTALRLADLWVALWTAVLPGAVLFANLREPLWVGQALLPWLALVVGLLCATYWIRPWFCALLTRAYAMPGEHSFPQAMSIAWALLLIAFGIRLAGSIHPLFNSHDVDVHISWLAKVVRGQWYLYSTPSEARGAQVFNPPAGYALMLPLGLILPSSRLIVQVSVALGDFVGCLALLLLALELRLPRRIALFSLGLYLAQPIIMTMLWWGFATNALAQSAWLVVLWLFFSLLRKPSPSRAAVYAVAVAALLMMHVGALPLVVVALGSLCLLALLPVVRRENPGWYLPLILTAAVALVTGLIYFAPAISPLLGADLSRSGNPRNIPRAARITWQALLIGYPTVMLLLTIPGLILLWRFGWRVRMLLLAWCGTCLLFLAIHLATGFMSRYFYFAAPLLCLASAAVLAQLSTRRWGYAVALTLSFLIGWSGLLLWLQGVFTRIKPSALPLSH